MRIRWTLILLGLVVGLALGLVYGFYIQPVSYSDTAPFTLQQSYREDMAVMIAAAYSIDGDLERARARVRLLGYENPAADLTALAQRSAASDTLDPQQVTLLSQLAFALGALQVAEAPTPTPPLTRRMHRPTHTKQPPK